jgi:endonuclease/exonuclease/phosphatase (EEP) superfamily protein YafD
MIKKFAFLAIAVFTAVAPVGAAPLLAPVDPLAWAVANADWSGTGGTQIDSLRKIVNGQVTAHQVNSAYTDPVNRVVKRIKCADPANCVMCSQAAGDAGQKLRQQISASASSAAGTASMYATLQTYAEARANALSEQARWNSLRKESTVTETVNVDGQDVTTTKTVKVENAADAEIARTAEVMKQLAQNAQLQTQQQGSLVYTYVGAAAQNLKSPEPAVELYAGSDPLE